MHNYNSKLIKKLETEYNNIQKSIYIDDESFKILNKHKYFKQFLNILSSKYEIEPIFIKIKNGLIYLTKYRNIKSHLAKSYNDYNFLLDLDIEEVLNYLCINIDIGTHIRLGRLFSLLKVKYKGSIDELSDKIKLYTIEVDFSILDNPSEIYTYFHTKSSCMSSKPKDYFSIYDNIKNCKILVAKIDDVIVGRALLWKPNEIVTHPNIISSDFNFLMDKIYTNYTYIKDYFILYANNNNIAYYLNSDTIKIADDKYFIYSITVKTPKIKYDCYPYLDNLKYYNYYDGTLSSKYSKYSLELRSTSGGYTRFKKSAIKELFFNLKKRINVWFN